MRMGTRLRGFAIAAMACFALAPVSALAQDSSADEPVIVVSITSLDRLMKDVNYVTEAVEQGQAGGMFQAVVGMYTNGIDRSRPVGIAFPLVDGMPTPLAFVPTSNVKRMLASFEAAVGPADELDDGTLAIATGPNLVFIRQEGDWAFVAQNRDLLQDLPEDPTPWLAGMDESYDVGVRINVRALSPDQREQAVQLMRQGFDSAMMNQPDAQAEQIRQMGEQSLEQLAQIINETETLQFGFAIEPNNKRLLFEFVNVAAAGTELAEMVAGYKAIPSKFSAVIQPDVAAYFHGAASISSKGIEQANMGLEQATGSISAALAQQENLSESDREELEAFFEKLIEVGKETVQEGKSDAGGLLTLENEELNAVAGFFVSDGEKVANLAKELAAKIKERTGGDDKLRFNFDADEYAGVTLHYVETDVPDRDEKAQMIFGETLRLTIGTGEDAVYLALGKQSEELLKGLIDSAGTDAPNGRPLSQGQVKLLPILEFAQSIQPNESLAAMIDAVAQYNDTDTVGFTSTPVERGTQIQFTIGEGILRAIGAAVLANQAQAEGAF